MSDLCIFNTSIHYNWSSLSSARRLTCKSPVCRTCAVCTNARDSRAWDINNTGACSWKHHTKGPLVVKDHHLFIILIFFSFPKVIIPRRHNVHPRSGIGNKINLMNEPNPAVIGLLELKKSTTALFSPWRSHIVIQCPIKVALVSSGARHSCEDHLRYPRPVSAARLKSLAFIQAQNENASNSSVLPTTSSFIFFSPLPQLRFLSPLCQSRGVPLLGSSAFSPFFSASVLCGEFAPLSSTLSVLLLPPLFFFFFLLPSSFPKTAIPYTRGERNLWRVSSARTHFLCLNVPESCHLFP